MKKWTEKKPGDCWVADIHDQFGIEIHDYDRPGDSLLISSGFGLGLALMDVLPQCRYFFDLDNYREHIIDWECLGVLLSFVGLRRVILAGWFTVDNPANFDKLIRGILIPKFIYRGGEQSLREFISDLK